MLEQRFFLESKRVEASNIFMTKCSVPSDCDNFETRVFSVKNFFSMKKKQKYERKNDFFY